MNRVLAQAAIFQGVEPAAADAPIERLHPVPCPRGHVFFTEGDPGDSMYLIVEGKVTIGRDSRDGRAHLLTVRGPSESFGELSVFDPGPQTSTAVALTELLARQFGAQEGGAVRVVHDLTQEELGHPVGSSRETVNGRSRSASRRPAVRR